MHHWLPSQEVLNRMSLNNKRTILKNAIKLITKPKLKVVKAF
jgi:hypothetical protein